MKEIYTSNHIWNLFENFLVDMARVRILAWLKRNLFYLFVDFGLCAHVYMVVRCVFLFFPPSLRCAEAPRTEIELTPCWRNMSLRSSWPLSKDSLVPSFLSAPPTCRYKAHTLLFFWETCPCSSRLVFFLSSCQPRLSVLCKRYTNFNHSCQSHGSSFSLILFQTHQNTFIRLLQSALRVSNCTWISTLQKTSIEACIKTLADVGELLQLGAYEQLEHTNVFVYQMVASV